eukprot:494923-Hanusia_phi.AAC.1
MGTQRAIKKKFKKFAQNRAEAGPNSNGFGSIKYFVESDSVLIFKPESAQRSEQLPMEIEGLNSVKSEEYFKIDFLKRRLDLDCHPATSEYPQFIARPTTVAYSFATRSRLSGIGSAGRIILLRKHLL